ncbi:2-amino-4-hydroxy-6-hydroxymethyldihydropteridine diphosphokinase [Paracoccus sp. IB05]|uniref:2-amino-4-hydroxy-6- hydroxymethyldihydropteridine diphosphokinase n=1 Tax=Paracoccus sp. IB05 TaxID=2779367 RepID=UPI0018E7398C|nr:2-amino-4-hydroxy-6-hydroxymethyldihydropteridine diphosphokinase [Paracoccus sp. IB05]MBJ2150375.1 2-amino-4-hydroxy-6-hydroxymethyldihydropteridine diphosphokinase [Paracoccus sp. IB05]
MKLIGDKPATPVVIALGANLPFADMFPVETLRSALTAISEDALTISGASSFWSTPCFPRGAGPDYVNAIILTHVDVRTDPAMILTILHRIEAKFGRERQERWGGRTLDLDLIAWGDSVLPDVETQGLWRNLSAAEQAQRAPDQLILPHPRMQDRAFVLVPMAEILPDWRHPLLGLTVREMLAALPEEDREAVKRIDVT